MAKHSPGSPEDERNKKTGASGAGELEIPIPSIDDLPTQPEWAVGRKDAPAVSAAEELPTQPKLAAIGKNATADQQAQHNSASLNKEQEASPPAAQQDSTIISYNDPTVSTFSSQVSQTSTVPAPYQGVPARAPSARPVIAVRDLAKTYYVGKTPVYALRGVSLEVYPGEFVAIMGPSGSGKSTFMNLLGCLDRPTLGEYWLDSKLVSRLSSDELAGIRNRMLGFVFQGFNLLSRATALSNVALPMIYAGLSKGERERRAYKLLQMVGLGARADHKPSELSGGQQQRVAIARALVNGPSLLLADEPTGNLDSRTSIEIMAVLQALNEQGLTIVLVTHESDIASYARRQIGFRDGRLVRDEPVLSPRSAQEEWEALVNTPSPESVAGSVQIKEEAR